MLSFVSAMRPQRWAKNSVIFLPALLSGNFADPYLSDAILVFLAFCLASSAGYVINDLLDAAADREHPRKRRRAIASGALSAPLAMALAAILALAFAFVAFSQATAVLALSGAYLGLSVAYSAFLKRIPLVDGASTSIGFVLRFLAGGPAIGIALNPWIFSALFLISMGMALSKRRGEFVASGKQSSARPALNSMNRSLLDVLVSVFMGAGLALYAAWAAGHPNIAMIFTLPFFSVALARLVWISYATGDGHDVNSALIRDWPMWASSALWIVSAILFAGAPA